MSTTVEPGRATVPPPVPAPPAESRLQTALRSWPVLNLIRFGLVAALLATWQIAVDTGVLDGNLFGSPSGVAAAMWPFLTDPATWENTAATMHAVLLAFVIGSGAGIVVGLLIGASSYSDRLFAPMLVPLNSIPRIALAPLFIAWFGLTITSKVVLAASIIFFILVENSRGAVRSLEPDLATMAKVFGLKRLSFVTKVVLPSAVPSLFAGLRLAVTYSLLGVIASEMIASRDGLGQLIVSYSSQLRIDDVWATLLLLVVIATLISAVFAVVERRLLRWQN